MLIAIPAYNYTLFELSDILSDPEPKNIAVIKFFQIFQSVTLFIIPALIAAWLFSEKPYKYLNADRGTSGFTVLLVLFSIVSAIPLLNYVTELNSRLDLPVWLDNIENSMIQMEETAAELTELFLKTNSTGDLLLNLLMIAILPAVGEEFLFRGILQKLFFQWFKKSNAAIIFTAFLFSFIHFQFFGFLPRFLLGLYFGYLMVWSGSIWVPVIAHLINNGLAVLYYHFAADQAGNTTIENIGVDDSNRYMLYISIVITSVIIGLIFIHEKDKSADQRNFL